MDDKKLVYREESALSVLSRFCVVLEDHKQKTLTSLHYYNCTEDSLGEKLI